MDGVVIGPSQWGSALVLLDGFDVPVKLSSKCVLMPVDHCYQLCLPTASKCQRTRLSLWCGCLFLSHKSTSIVTSPKTQKSLQKRVHKEYKRWRKG